MDEYDPCELLIAGKGRSTQDGFYLREITDTFRGSSTLGRQVARARMARNMTQSELADASGIRLETISRIERGNANPTMRTLERIADALGRRVTISFG